MNNEVVELMQAMVVGNTVMDAYALLALFYCVLCFQIVLSKLGLSKISDYPNPIRYPFKKLDIRSEMSFGYGYPIRSFRISDRIRILILENRISDIR